MTRAVVTAVLAAALVSVAPAAWAADIPAPAIAEANCAPVAGAGSAPSGALRVSGGQSVEPRNVFGPSDTLIIDGGSARGVSVGQRYFVRRAQDWDTRKSAGVHTVSTAGGLRIVAVNDATALAVVDFVCEAIMTSDFLVPYVEPPVPADWARADVSGELDFSSTAHVLYGKDDRTTSGVGEFMLTDVGTSRGVIPGARFAVYRDMGRPGLPLQPIGEAIVVSSDANASIVRLTATRDAVRIGDLLVARKPKP